MTTNPQLTPAEAIGTTAEAMADALLSACAAMLVVDRPGEVINAKDIRGLAVALLDRVITRTREEGPKPS